MKKIRKNVDPYGEEQWEDEHKFKFIWWPKIKWVLKFLFGVTIAIVVISGIRALDELNKKNRIESLYWKEYCIIKHKDPQNKLIIIQRMIDTTYYAELVAGGLPELNIDNKWDSFYYSRKVGDTLFFKYIKKDRFFKTTNGIINK